MRECACGYAVHFSWPNMEQGFTLTVVEQYFTLKLVAEKTHWALQVRKCGFLCQHGGQVR